MFNGIIQATGKILSIENSARKGRRFIIDAGKLSSQMNEGDSLAVDGICLTVTQRNGNKVSFDVSPETLKRTNLNNRSKGSHVNLELPITATTMISGHFVQGHIEGTGLTTGWKKNGTDVKLKVELPENLIAYCIPKGSIAINGVSLTIAELHKKSIEIALIPYTMQHTNLGDLHRGDLVNIETDMIGRYVVSVVKNTYDRGSSRRGTRKNPRG